MMHYQRRECIQLGLGAATAALSGKLFATPLSTPAPVQAKAKSLIQIWLWGGACHLDTFDPKPNAGAEYCGPYNKALPTVADGMEICMDLPLLAQQAQHYSLIRSMTHGVNGHETASYLVQTGHRPGNEVYPTIGAVLAHLQGHKDNSSTMIPPYVVLTKAQGRFSEAGFLGSPAKPFVTGGNPAGQPFEVEGIIAKGITRKQQISRRNLLQNLDTLEERVGTRENLQQSQASREQAYELILGDAGKVFDLSLEKESLRQSYGMNPFGQACLAARRLVQIGVKSVTINFDGWDTHKQHFSEMKKKLPMLDMGLSTLIRDCSEQGLLDSTLIWCMGEFGRTPKIQPEAPWNGGRSHFGEAFSALLAGGGLRGGRIVGATNGTGSEVIERPVYPWDLSASIYRQFGIPLDTKLIHPYGYELPLFPPETNEYRRGGLLNELT